MRNKKLFTLISIILILSLLFIGCGKKSQVENDEIGKEETTVEEDKNTGEIETMDIEEEDVEENIDISETVDSEKQDSSTSNKTMSKENKNVEEEKKRINTSTERKSSPSNEEKIIKPSVTITIIGPEDVGTILAATEVEIEDGDTVFNILKQVVKDNNIQMEYKGRKSSVYIQGIHNIYEFDKGPESGWIYRVNGEVSQISCGEHKLNAGDKIEWLYSTKLGREFDNKGGGK